MRRLLLIFALLLLPAGNLPAGPDSAGFATLTVKVTGTSDQGTISVGLYDNPAEFERRDMYRGMKLEPVEGGSVAVVFTNVHRGTYAVAVYQDVNGNNELDRHSTGYPSEPFGFSRNPRIAFGPPEFEECAFDVKPGKVAIAVKLN